MARPVVASPEALEGITAQIGNEIIRADGATAFANQTLTVLDDQENQGMGDRARRRVINDYGWPSNLAGLKTLLENGRLDKPTG